MVDRSPEPRSPLFGRRRRGGAPLLYALLDTGLVEAQGMEAEALRLVEGGVDCLQLRAKELSPRELYHLACGVHSAIQGRGVPLILNDRVDVALAAGLEGAHVGSEDLPPDLARKVLGPSAILGVTAHDGEEAARVGEAADYIGFGAVHPTQTRPESRVCGVAALTRVAAGTSLPVIAIGGIGPQNVEGLRDSHIAGVAVGSAIAPAVGGDGALASLRRILDTWVD